MFKYLPFGIFEETKFVDEVGPDELRLRTHRRDDDHLSLLKHVNCSYKFQISHNRVLNIPEKICPGSLIVGVIIVYASVENHFKFNTKRQQECIRWLINIPNWSFDIKHQNFDAGWKWRLLASDDKDFKI